MGVKSLVRDIAFLYISYKLLTVFPIPFFEQLMYGLVLLFFVVFFNFGKIKGFK